MKLAVEREFSQSSVGTKSIGFGIKASAKAFKIISSGIYSDKIRAVIRELSTNAYDSHVAAGCVDEPFDVKLPTWTTPEFYVRDYGTGLTPEELGLIEGVPGIYTTYFDSNKTDSNEYTGCLGLGSKSPFSYANNFVVESFKDGKHYICSAHLNERGEPSISLMSCTDTNEADGLKVTVAVNQGDCTNFIMKAESVYKHFKIKPKFIGTQLAFEEPKIVAEGSGWRLLKEYGDAVAIMGNVAYPVTCDNTEFTQDDKAFLDCTFEMWFETGELDFDAGRESLGYDKRTIACLKRKCAEIRAEISDKFKDIYSDCTNIWEARLKYVYVKNELSSLMSFIKLPNIYNGVKLFEQANWTVINVKIPDLEMTKYNRNSYAKKMSTNSNGEIRFEHTNYKFYENDVKIGAISRCQEFLNHDQNKTTIVLLKFNTTKARQDFLEFTGMPASEIGLISSLSTATRAARSGNSIPSLEKICKYKKDKYQTVSSRCWENITHDINNGGIYVELNRGKVVSNGRPEHAGFVKSVIEGVTSLDKTIEVFGVKTQLIPKVKKMNQWVDLKDLVKKLLDDHPEYEELAKLAKSKDSWGYSNIENMEAICKLGVTTSPEITALVELDDKLTHLGNTDEKVNAFDSLYRIVHGTSYFVPQGENTLDKALKAVIMKYPLLGMIRHAEQNEMQEFTNYVNMVDKETK